MRRDEAWRAIHLERAALADLLDSLTPAEWEHESVCAGWTVRDVAAHVISSPQAGLGTVTAALLRNRGSFNRTMFAEAKRAAARPTADIVADYRRLAGSRRHPPGTTYLDPLLDVLVHTQDIAVPLGRRHPMPVEAARAAADRVWRIAFLFGGRGRFRGFRVRATDADWSAGVGPVIEGPMEAILLLLAGRTAVALPRLSGEGAGLYVHRGN